MYLLYILNSDLLCKHLGASIINVKHMVHGNAEVEYCGKGATIMLVFHNSGLQLL